ncbi:hypothetical protein [Vibrio vulnificus]|uniref:hypothetical protein n=1 Tax=Vibrio vulnificus TaxID=672 RepID=UPI000CD13874|nr:hypothetical protein [Vibrio vulnificus]EHZ2549488.1 hypothetical protein [Vibrio vulnificus]EIN9355491.1 hypothetical protein [Vibrio vulnificus]MBN8140937.1 hypothetical protein [Vibrio vulnificus]MBN8150158.1 hypothetical protein [Vibrio vulnificus]MCA3963588.1 hypothetical protein [Vibrio vulnificus]
MNRFYTKFPPLPLYKGHWGAIQIEPIIGSGERITIAVCAVGEDGDFKVVQSLSDDVLDLLYTNQKQNMIDLIQMAQRSVKLHMSTSNQLSLWKPPFAGVGLSKINEGLDIDIDGIIAQGLRFSSSFSTLLIDSKNDLANKRKRESNRFSNLIFKHVFSLNPSLKDSFNRRIKVSDSEAMTTFGFLNDKYVSNFGLLVPTNLSGSLTNIKARIFDIEALKKSNLLFKPDTYEVIVGSPSFEDPTLSDKSIYRLRSSFEMIEEIADKDDIRVYRVNDANDAAERLIKQAA